MRQRQLRRKVPDITLLLYVVEIDTEDLLYVADLNHFTNGEEAFAREDEQALADAVKGYLSGLAADGYDKTKWEFLASKVSVKHAVGPPPRTRPHV